ncbi:MAG: alanine racemase [Peptococcaceae bacterium]|nr:alanine racemase [Peptococcaceae bacterium]
MSKDIRPVWAAIDLQALRHNYRLLQNLCHPGGVMPIVKADAYGHGAVEAVEALWAEGARMFGVAYLEEALELSEKYNQARILVMGPSLPTKAEAFVAAFHGTIIPAVSSWDQAVAFSQAASHAGTTLGVHIKVDTGMGRLGFLATRTPGDSSESVAHIIQRISRLPGLHLEGIYTHLTDADEEISIADEQWGLFQEIRSDLTALGVSIPVQHIANSAGILRWTGRPDRMADYSRPGIVLYGISPSSDPRPPADFRPVLSLCSKITHIKDLPAGHSVSYNRTYVAKTPIRFAILPLGYADGLRRELSNLGQVLIRGCRAPIIGRVCMDQTMVDVTGIPDAAVGDEAILIGRSGQDEITAGEMAGWCRTIPYEIVCGISKRVPRVYVNSEPA